MHCRNALSLAASLAFASACSDASSFPTATRTRLPNRTSELAVAVPGDVALHHSNTHDLRIRDGHLLVDGTDHGRISASAQKGLEETFLAHDSALRAMSELRSRGFAHVKLHRAKLPSSPKLNRSRSAAPNHRVSKASLPTVPALYFQAGRQAIQREERFVPTNRLLTFPLDANREITDESGWCTESYDNTEACYYFLVDFQSTQDAYVAARETQMNGFFEWLSDMGSDTFQDLFSDMLSEMAGDEASAYAKAIVSAFEFYTEVVDEYETEQLIEMYDELNVDVWVGRTLGVWDSDWSIECNEPDADIDYPDVCGDLNEE